VADVDGMEVHDIEPRVSGEADQLLVCAPGEEARRHVRVIVDRAFGTLVPAVHADEEQPTGAQDRSDRRQDGRQVMIGHVEQAVHSEHRVERADREVQVQEVHDMGLDALGTAVLDHHRREVGRHDGKAFILEVGAVLPGAGTDLQQPRARCQPLPERLPFHQFPRLLAQPVTPGRARVVRLTQRAKHFVISDRHTGHYRRAWPSLL